jgi:signal transduction histidine kinase
MREKQTIGNAAPKFPVGHSENHVAASETVATQTGTNAETLKSRQQLAGLVALERRTLYSYFRLAEADRMLRARRRSAQGRFGAALSEQLDCERKRIGRELHTSAGQALAGITIYLGILQELLPDPPEDVRLSLDRIGMLTREALAQVEGISRSLYSPAWQNKPLVDALRLLWETSGITEKMEGTLDLQDLPVDPPLELHAGIYRIAQEGLSNVIRHSDARHVRLSLRVQGRNLVLEITDDGHGFNPAQELAPGASGIGLHSMRELARHLGGDLHIQSGSKGTTLTVSFPVHHDQP